MNNDKMIRAYLESAEDELSKFKTAPPKPTDEEHQIWAMSKLMNQPIKAISQHMGETPESVKAAIHKAEVWKKFESLLEDVGPYHRLKSHSFG